MDPSRLARHLKDHTARLGLEWMGVTLPDVPGRDTAAYGRWLAAGHHGEMEYMARPDAVGRREALEDTLSGVRAVVVVAEPYPPDDPPGIPDDPSLGVIARYARGRDYHKVLLRKLQALARGLPDGVEGRTYVDTGPLLERALGRMAGLGWQGKNTMLIHPRRGSYFFLGSLLLDAEVAGAGTERGQEERRDASGPAVAGEGVVGDHCGTCRACLDACPTGALLGRDETGAPVMDARRCISYLTIEQQGPIPEELRPLLGNRVFGCDICQEVCPFTRKFSEPSSEPAYAARGPGERPSGVERDPTSSSAWHPGTASPPLVDLLSTALDEDAWESFSRGSAIRRAGRAGFARNVCVALGNWGDPSAVAVLSEALVDPGALVRGHAAWALGRIDSPESSEALRSALASESEPVVREEITRALAGRSSSVT